MEHDKKQLATANILAFMFVLVIIVYSATGPLSEFVRWFIENTSSGFDELSRRDQRGLLKSHWLGAGYKSFERAFLLPTGMILGLPILFSFAICFLTLSHASRTWVNWLLAALSIVCFHAWMLKLFAVDGGALPAAQTLDYVLFPLATLLTMYLTWRLFGGFIVGFCLFWIIYFFVRGCCRSGRVFWLAQRAVLRNP